MTRSVRFKPSALRELEQLPKPVRLIITGKIERLAEDPFPAGSKRLKGLADVYRIRSGDYRILYLVEVSQQVVRVLRIRHRSEAYRGL